MLKSIPLSDNLDHLDEFIIRPVDVFDASCFVLYSVVRYVPLPINNFSGMLGDFPRLT